MEDIFSWSYIKIKRRLKVNGELGLLTSKSGGNAVYSGL
jgi:hypothetical protein